MSLLELLDDEAKTKAIDGYLGEVPLEILLSAGRFDPVQLDLKSHQHHDCGDTDCAHHDHAETFSTWSFETDQQLSLDLLREAAKNLLTNIYRCKGVIHSTDSPDRRTVLQVVGKRVELCTGEAWGERPRRTQIVAIGAFGSIDARLLENTFTSCISATAARRHAREHV